MQAFFVYVYCLPLWHIAALVLIFGFCWRWLVQAKGPYASKRAALFAKAAFAGCFVIWCAAILWQTVWSRTPGEPRAQWEPFFQLKTYFSGGDRELLRTLWMNVLLFLPGGFLLAALLPRRWRPFWLGLAFFALCSFSAVIEWQQYCGGLGLAETDDVLCNSLGAFLGIGMEEARKLPAYKRSV